MGVVLKLQLTTRIFWLLFPSPFWAWLLPSLDMATVMDMDMDMAMVDMVTTDIMARGLLMLSQLPPLSQLLLLSLDMDMAMDMAMDMVAMDTMDIMARGPLMPDMDMVDMVMDMAMVMAMVMVMDMDTMVKL